MFGFVVVCLFVFVLFWGFFLGFYVWFGVFLFCVCGGFVVVGSGLFVCLFSFNAALPILKPLHHCLEENTGKITFLGRQIFESKC